MMEITVRDLMKQAPVTIHATASIDDAVETMMREKVADLYVLGENDQLLGVVPDYELLKLYLNGLTQEQTVLGITSNNITTIQPGLPIMQVSPLFRNSYLERIAVVDNGCLVGELCRLDVIWLLSTVDRVLKGEQIHDQQVEERPRKRVPPNTPKFLKQQGIRARGQEEAY